MISANHLVAGTAALATVQPHPVLAAIAAYACCCGGNCGLLYDADVTRYLGLLAGVYPEAHELLWSLARFCDVAVPQLRKPPGLLYQEPVTAYDWAAGRRAEEKYR